MFSLLPEVLRTSIRVPILCGIALLLSFRGTAPAAQVVFSEVMYRPILLKPEYIEVWNITVTPLDMALWRFTAGIEFTFPDFNAGSAQAHFLKGGERIIVSSADDAATRAAYPGIPAGVRIFGPWTAGTTLSDSGERVTLEDKNGVIETTLSYGDDKNWLIAPDGTGHSLVLTNENIAQDDWRVWRSSTNNGGSPGVADPAPFATGIELNEVHFRASDGHIDWIEVRNNSPTTQQPLAGFFLASTDDLSNKIAIDGTLAVGAVASFNVDFTPAADGVIRLYLTDSSSRVRDAVKIRRKIGRDAWQVFPAGSHEWYSDTTSTRDGQNNPARNTNIVINEIMADPPSNQRDGEFIEVHNRGSLPVDLGNWRLEDAVDFIFPNGLVIPPGGYVVVGANAAWLNTNYPGLSAIGNWDGNLNNSKERIRLMDSNGNLANQVDYRFGGEWPELAGGSGSSLELANPNGDNSVGSAWRDSDESTKSTFQSFTIDGGTYRRLSNNGVTDDEILMWLVGDGHLVFKNAVLRPTAGGSNLFVNGEVTTLANNNTSGWQSRGTHWATYHDAEGVHVIADGGGDNKVSHVEKDALGMSVNVAYTLTFNARWIYGSPRLVAQSWDSSWGGTVLLPIPNNLGTPGLQNSRYLAAPPATLTALRQTPVIPNTSSTVTITVQVGTTVPLTSVQLFHRLDKVDYTGDFTSTAMVDNGTAGDSLAGDGIYTGVVPLSSFGYAASGNTVEYYVRATAASGQITDLPRGSVTGEPFATAPPRTGMWVVDNNGSPIDLRRIRIVMSKYWRDALNTPDANTGGGSLKFKYKFPKLQGHYFPCVFIHNDTDIYYSCGVQKAGSPFTRGLDNTLDRGRVSLPGDRPFRGASKLYWDNDSAGGSMLHNRISRYMLYLTGVPGNENEVCRVQTNNSGYNVRESNEFFDKDMIDRIWPDGSSGQFFEMDDRHEIGDDGANRLNSIELGWDYNPPNSPGADNAISYHNNYTPKSREVEYDYGSLIEWNKQLETVGLQLTISQLNRMADIPAMAAYAAVRGYTADWDSITLSRAKNGYFYNRSTDHKWLMLHWDSDNAFQNTHVNDAVIGTETNVQMLYGNPVVRRYANHFLHEMITRFATNGPRVSAWLAAEESASPSYSVPSIYATWPTTVQTAQNRHQVIQSFIGNSFNSAFGIASPPNGSTATASTIDVVGVAPTTAFSVICVSHPEATFAWIAPTVNDVSPWRMTGIRLASGLNSLVFQMRNLEGTQVGSNANLSITKTNDAPPVASITSEPGSQNVALGDVLTVDASGSFDPDGQTVSYAWSVTPPDGFAMTAPSPSTRKLVFTTPGSYTVNVEVNDGTTPVSTQRVYSVYSPLDSDGFNGTLLGGYTFANIKQLDNYASDTWYSVNETDGRLAVQVGDRVTFPLRVATPTFPLITRTLPSSADFALQTAFILEGRQFGTFLTGLYLETVESGTTVRYAFGLENGSTIRVMRSATPAAYASIGGIAFTGGELVLRVVRVGTNLSFQYRSSGIWVNVGTPQVIGAGTVSGGGLFAATGPNNGSTTSPGQSLRVAFDYLLLTNPASTSDHVANLRITEVMYNPSAGGVEFVELRNIGAAPLNLNGCYFENSLPFSAQFTFGDLTLPPGGYCVVTEDIDRFTEIYGAGVTIAGQYSGSMNNDGERILLKDPIGNIIHDFTFDDANPWPGTPDGQGPSLEVVSTDPAIYNFATNWRASFEIGGSPGFLGLSNDSDGDGFGDSYETAYGSNPASTASIPLPPNATRETVSGYVTVTWGSVPGQLYTVEYRDSLDTGTWLPLGSVKATSASSSLMDTSSGVQSQRFYHVRAPLH